MLSKALSPASSCVHVIESANTPDKTVLVGAYCRVSTNHDVQKASLETQMMAYEKIINDHPGWVLAGIYADKGLSGTSVNRRTEFQRMISDAKDGKLNYILVKSISRFSRNTVDLLKYVRELNEIGVHVYFEKEHLDTGHSSEFLLTLFGAHAQEEIISLSENMKVGRRMRFAKGEKQWTNLYGYAKGWKIERISKTALAVLRCALCEILYMEDIPDSAAINEAVELAKGYDEPDTVAFVNGVLGGFMRGRLEN